MENMEKEVGENEIDVVIEKETKENKLVVGLKKVVERLKGKVKSCKKGECKCKHKKLVIAVVAVLVIALAGFFGYREYRQRIDVGQGAIKTKVQKFIDKNVPQTASPEIKNVLKDGQLYTVNISINKQEMALYVTTDGKKLIIPGEGILDLDEALSQEAKAPAEPKKYAEIPKTDKPVVDLYVMSFCPFGNKAEDTLKSAYNLLKNKVDFKFHYIVNSKGDEIESLHGAKEVAQNEREACVLKQSGKDKWMNFVTYVNTNCGTDGTCWEAGAKSLGLSTANISKCVETEGVALMKQDEKDSNAVGANGSPAMFINGVETDVVYQYGNSEGYKQKICDAFNKTPAECAKKLEAKAPAGSDTSAASCGN